MYSQALDFRPFCEPAFMTAGLPKWLPGNRNWPEVRQDVVFLGADKRIPVPGDENEGFVVQTNIAIVKNHYESFGKLQIYSNEL